MRLPDTPPHASSRARLHGGRGPARVRPARRPARDALVRVERVATGARLVQARARRPACRSTARRSRRSLAALVRRLEKAPQRGELRVAQLLGPQRRDRRGRAAAPARRGGGRRALAPEEAPPVPAGGRAPGLHPRRRAAGGCWWCSRSTGRWPSVEETFAASGIQLGRIEPAVAGAHRAAAAFRRHRCCSRRSRTSLSRWWCWPRASRCWCGTSRCPPTPSAPRRFIGRELVAHARARPRAGGARRAGRRLAGGGRPGPASPSVERWADGSESG